MPTKKGFKHQAYKLMAQPLQVFEEYYFSTFLPIHIFFSILPFDIATTIPILVVEFIIYIQAMDCINMVELVF